MDEVRCLHNNEHSHLHGLTRLVKTLKSRGIICPGVCLRWEREEVHINFVGTTSRKNLLRTIETNVRITLRQMIRRYGVRQMELA
jgi:hypothetical protein